MERKKIYLFLESKIISEEWKENTKLLSENQLCTKFNISRMTARNVLNDLFLDGYIYSIKGSGYYVNKKIYWVKNISDSKKDKINYDQKLLNEIVELPPWFVKRYELNPNEFTNVIKTRCFKNKTKNIVYVFLNNTMLKRVNKNKVEQSVIKYLQEYFEFENSYSYFVVEEANEIDKKYLDLTDNNLVMCKYSVIFHKNETIIQCAVSKQPLFDFNFGYVSRV